MHDQSLDSVRQIRQTIRSSSFQGQTSGLVPGYVQANLCVLPRSLAADFLLFCQRNPKPCPLLATSDPGSYRLPTLSSDIDIRTDIPKYRIWKEGELVDECTDLLSVWNDDLVAFALGCSFSFEEALIQAGIEIRHITQGRNVPMYRTSIRCQSAGPFSGPMVVTMRPMSSGDAIRAVQVTSRFPGVHGAPIHWGDPSAIGITDLQQPDYGDAVDLYPGEVPVFWACGVTPQAIVAQSRTELCITHAPGAMLITDLRNAELASG